MLPQFGFDTIHIIESLPESDGNPGKQLCDRLNVRSLNGIEAFYHFVFDQNDLTAVIKKILAEAPKTVPLLHFEVHGNKDGFELRSKEFVGWKEIGSSLWAINRASDFHLLVVWSCCFGIHQIEAMSAFQPAPFIGVVGSNRTAYTDELLAGFSVFYPALINTGKRDAALRALQAEIVSGATFGFFTVIDAFQGAYRKVRKDNASGQAFPDRAAHIRSQLEIEAKQRGGAIPQFSDGQIKAALDQSEPKALRDFYEAFFACDQFPKNRERFPFAVLTADL